MARRGRHRPLRWILAAAGGVAGAVLLSSGFVQLRYQGRIRPPSEVPPAPVALVFGAGLTSGEPSPILAERLDAAIALYQAKKVRKLLVSGDSSDRYHDEARAMRRYALERGVPAGDVVADLAGISTYDTCFRAQAVYGVRRAILVTQAFHLSRALFIANSLGIDADGVVAGRGDASEYQLREFFSRSLALAMVLVRPDAAHVGPREPIE